MRFVSILLLVCSFCTLDVTAQWQQTNGLFGGTINCLTASGTYLFAGTGNGVWQSADSGNTWQNASNGIPFKTEIGSITIDGNHMYATSCCNGVFWSHDGGASWQPFVTQFAINGAQQLIVDNQTVYFAASQCLYATSDTGITYTNLTNNTITDFISCFAKSGNHIYLGTNNAGMYISHDNGATWNADTIGASGLHILSITPVGNEVYTTVLSEGVFVSHDHGVSWTDSNNGLNSYYTSEFIAVGSHLFVAVNDTSVYESGSNGSQWNALSNMPLGATIHCFANMGSVLFAGTNEGVFKSSNNGASWTIANNQLASPSVNCLATGSGNYLFAASTIGTIYSTVDNGNTWILNKENPPQSNITSLATSGANLLAATTNGLWSSNYLIPSPGSLLSLPSGNAGPVAVSATTIFCGTSSGVHRSSDNGNTWININAGIPNGQTVTSLATTNSNVYSVFAGTGSYGGLHYASVNGFAFSGWGNTNLPPVNALSVNASKAFAGTNNGIYSSTNNGVNYSFYNTLAKVNAILYKNGYVIAGTDSGVFFSGNNGLVWTKKNNGLMNHLKITSIASIDTMVFIGTLDGGVFKSSLSSIINDTLLLTQLQELQKTEKQGLQMYPNPVTHRLYIEVTDATSILHSVHIYDVLGCELQLPTTFSPTTSNATCFVLSTSDLKNGVYLVKVGNEVRRFIKE